MCETARAWPLVAGGVIDCDARQTHLCYATRNDALRQPPPLNAEFVIRAGNGVIKDPFRCHLVTMQTSISALVICFAPTLF